MNHGARSRRLLNFLNRLPFFFFFMAPTRPIGQGPFPLTGRLVLFPRCLTFLQLICLEVGLPLVLFGFRSFGCPSIYPSALPCFPCKACFF